MPGLPRPEMENLTRIEEMNQLIPGTEMDGASYFRPFYHGNEKQMDRFDMENLTGKTQEKPKRVLLGTNETNKG